MQLKSLFRVATAAFVLCMCKPPEKKEVPQITKGDTTINSEDSSNVAEKPIADTLIKTVRFYEDTAKILTTGQFHGDEVWVGAGSEEWFALFQTQPGFALKKTTIVTRRIKDDLLDMEGDTTGWSVSTENSQESLILIAGLTFLTERIVESIELPQREIYPGDSIDFTFNGGTYSIHANGIKAPAEYSPGEYEVSDYKLYLTARKGKENISQLLVRHRGFDGAMVSIVFAGDIDDDGVPDLILNTTNHYNVSQPTLFLSRPAKKGSVLKIMGAHRTVGC